MNMIAQNGLIGALSQKWRLAWDRALPVHLLPNLLGKPDPIILEIGSNDGQDAQRFLDVLPSATLHCFEPDPRAIARWHQTVSSPRATLHEIAIGAEDGTATFHQSSGGTRFPKGWDLSGSLRAPTGHLEKYPSVHFDTTITVPVRSLDAWAAEAGIDAVDFIWDDIQGAECDLIEGGSKTLSRTRYFYTEYGQTEMYAGQWRLEQIAQALPDHRLLHHWKQDALFVLRREGAP